MIKVGDLIGLVVSCLISDYYCLVVEEDIMLFFMDLFDCIVMIEVLMLEVIDVCFDEWIVFIEVVSVDMSNDMVIYIIIDMFLEDDLCLIIGLEIGEYKFCYIVIDDCGNSIQ